MSAVLKLFNYIKIHNLKVKEIFKPHFIYFFYLSPIQFKTIGAQIQTITFYSEVIFVNLDLDDLNNKARDPPGFFPEIPKVI